MGDQHIDGAAARGKVPTRSRRRFLTSVGITGLTVAAAVFGRSTAAQAYTYGCCNLAMKPNKTYSQCRAGENMYTWACTLNRCEGCSCCENRYWGGDHWIYTASAASCGNFC